MLYHLVLMKFNPEVKEADIDALEQAFERLPDIIVEIQSYEFGRDIVRSERSYDFGLVSLFANIEALNRYREHPEHQKVLVRIKKMCADIVAVDFEPEPLVSVDTDDMAKLFT